LWHLKELSKENDGGRSTKVAQQDVHERPDGCVGKQNCGAADMGGAPDLLHRELARMQTILCDDGKEIAIQRGSTP
jgi:hypothetical protein